MQDLPDGVVDLGDGGKVTCHDGGEKVPIFVFCAPVEELLLLDIGLLVVSLAKSAPWRDVLGVIEAGELAHGGAREVRLGEIHVDEPWCAVLPLVNELANVVGGDMGGGIRLVHVVYLSPKAIGRATLGVIFQPRTAQLFTADIHVVACHVGSHVVASLPRPYKACMIAESGLEVSGPRVGVGWQVAGFHRLVIVPKGAESLHTLTAYHGLASRTTDGDGGIAVG